VNKPTISVCLTIYDRTPEVLTKVFDSLDHQGHDELVVVLDRSPKKVNDWVRDYLHADSRATIVEIAGDPGWKGPAKAWNTGFARVTSELIYCLSSEVIQKLGNVGNAVGLLAERPAIVFGKAECTCGPTGTEVNWNGTAPGNLLVDSEHPRPLGFIWAGPMWAVRATTGFDEGYMGGFWYDDDDFTYRLWQLGIPFVFTDTIYGSHQHHERVELSRQGIAINAAYHQRKWGGTCRVTPVRQERRPGVTTWYSR